MKKVMSIALLISIITAMLCMPAFADEKLLYNIDFENESADTAPTVGNDETTLTNSQNALVVSEDGNLFVRAKNEKAGTAYATLNIEKARRNGDEDKSVIMLFDIRTPDEFAQKDIRLSFAPEISSTAMPTPVTIMKILNKKLQNSAGEEILDMTDGSFKSLILKYDDFSKDYTVYCDGAVILSGNISEINPQVKDENLYIYELGFYNVSNRQNNRTGNVCTLDVDNIVIQNNVEFSGKILEEETTLTHTAVKFNQPVSADYITKENITVDGYEQTEYELSYDKTNRVVNIDFLRPLEVEQICIIQLNNIYSATNELISVTEYRVVGGRAIQAAVVGGENNVSPVFLEIEFSRPVLPECLIKSNVSIENVLESNFDIESREEDGKSYLDFYFDKPLHVGSAYTVKFANMYGYSDDEIGTKEINFITMPNNANEIVRKRTFEAGSKIADTGDTPDVGVRLWTNVEHITDTVEYIGNSNVWRLNMAPEAETTEVFRGIYDAMTGQRVVEFECKLSQNMSGSFALRNSMWTMGLVSFKDNTASSFGEEFATGIYDKWLHFVFVFDGKTVTFVFNGKQIYTKKEVLPYDTTANGTEFRISLNHTPGVNEDFLFDNYYSYVPGLTNAAVNETQTANDVIVNFTNPINGNTVKEGAVTIDGLTDYTAYLSADAKTLHINMQNVSAGSRHTLKLSKRILDITGKNVYSEKEYVFSTKPYERGPSSIKYYTNYGSENQVEVNTPVAGEITAEAVFNNLSTADETAYLLFGVYNSKTKKLVDMCGAKLLISANSGEIKYHYTFNVPDGDCEVNAMYVENIAQPLVFAKLKDLNAQLVK